MARCQGIAWTIISRRAITAPVRIRSTSRRRLVPPTVCRDHSSRPGGDIDEPCPAHGHSSSDVHRRGPSAWSTAHVSEVSSGSRLTWRVRCAGPVPVILLVAASIAPRRISIPVRSALGPSGARTRSIADTSKPARRILDSTSCAAGTLARASSNNDGNRGSSLTPSIVALMVTRHRRSVDTTVTLGPRGCRSRCRRESADVHHGVSVDTRGQPHSWHQELISPPRARSARSLRYRIPGRPLRVTSPIATKPVRSRTIRDPTFSVLAEACRVTNP